MRKNRSESLSPSRPEPSRSLVPVPPPQPVFDGGPPDSGVASEAGDAGLPLAHYIWLLRTNLWKILVFVALVVIATATVSVRLTPEYESTATLYVDRGAAKDIVGKDSQSQSGNAGADADAFLASQVKLLQSDSVVRPLAEKYNLLEREKQIKEKDDREAQIKVRTAPIVLKGLRIARAAGTYVIQIIYRSTDRDVSTGVANGIAESYIEHTYDIISVAPPVFPGS